MMIQVTNRCQMLCPHCLDDSRPCGEDCGMITADTFDKACKFAADASVWQVLISGGEPTEHPNLAELCKIAANHGLNFTICTNGMWMGDAKAEWRMEKIAKMKACLYIQLYTNPRWYRLHDKTIAEWKKQESRWRSMSMTLVTDEIRSMQALGRAKHCNEAMEEVRKSKYHNACLVPSLMAHQCSDIKQFSFMMNTQGHFCTPLVDWQGNLHMSESWLCPHIGSVLTDTTEQLWEKMRQFRPCGGCYNCKKFLREKTDKMAQVRKILGFNPEGEEA